jgi:hypothetical protein
MREGATFPPILVTRRPHTPEVLTVIDGFHRIEAALRHCEYERKHLHQTYLDAVVIRPYGDQEELEATLLVNTTHGLPLTKADNKRRLELAHTISRLRDYPHDDLHNTLAVFTTQPSVGGDRKTALLLRTMTTNHSVLTHKQSSGSLR